MVELTNKEFFQDLDQTIAAQLFEQTTYPWEILPLIKDFILKNIKKSSRELFYSYFRCLSNQS